MGSETDTDKLIDAMRGLERDLDEPAPHQMFIDSMDKKLAARIWAAQDASNCGGVGALLVEVTSLLYKHPECGGTDWVNTHPFRVVLLDKLCHLAGCQNFQSPVIDEASRYVYGVIADEYTRLVWERLRD